MNSYGDGTRVVHAVDAAPGEPFGAQPVFASVYHLGGQNTYGRTSNPTWSALETALGALDGGECVVFPVMQRSALQLVQLKLDELESSGPFAVVHSQPIDLLPDALHLVECPTNGVTQAAEIRKLVEHVHVPRGIEELLVLVLAVQLDQLV